MGKTRFPFLEVPMFFMGQENKELPPGMAGLEGIEVRNLHHINAIK